MSNNDNVAKDVLARTIIWGGFAVAKHAICVTAVAMGLVDKYAAKNVAKYMAKMGPREKERLWNIYKETGSIGAIFDNL